MAGIYIHIPFCKQACHYCDFHFTTNLSNTKLLAKSIAKEIELQKDFFSSQNTIETIYFGGGTPSLLEKNELEIILNAIHKSFSISDLVEVTLEANPDDLSSEKITELKNLNFNRLSIGIQSFKDSVLKFLNRSHSATQAKRAIEQAKDAGIHNVSIDLIYGIPTQTNKMWLEDIQQALDLDVPHISSYCLTVEEKTVFGNWLKKGKFTPQEDSTQADHFKTLVNTLQSSGFWHYEISNFAKEGYFSKHNSSYWENKEYLGVGPSAHSFDGRIRQFNVKSNPLYLKAIQKGYIPYNQEVLTKENIANEYIMTSLRTMWGCDLKKLYKSSGLTFSITQKEQIELFLKESKITFNDSIVKLTMEGKLFADSIAASLFFD